MHENTALPTTPDGATATSAADRIETDPITAMSVALATFVDEVNRIGADVVGEAADQKDTAELTVLVHRIDDARGSLYDLLDALRDAGQRGSALFDEAVSAFESAGDAMNAVITDWSA
ncbi:hypothetical protein [Saccharothrix sp.]|uniref:hypothetical protein n=1 Tax=Saccharothrix sp. TaxID=1873460 RepID=UPI0028122418|nr:hypothetical protein [Saccharothrix sp.]